MTPTDQHNIDIAEECEHRLDEHYSVHSSINCKSVNVAELHADLARYAAHMRQQAERIEKLERLVRDAVPIIVRNPFPPQPTPDEWIAKAKEILK